MKKTGDQEFRDTCHPPESTRRNFILSTGCFLSGLALAGATWMTCSFITGLQLHSNSGPVDLGSPDLYKSGSAVRVGRLTVLRDAAGVWAVDGTCGHLGCRPEYSEKMGLFLCPCHGSRFDLEGRYLSGPAGKDLKLVALHIDMQGRLLACPNEEVKPGYRFII